MIKKFSNPYFWLFLIFLLGLFLRFYKLGEIPSVLTRDEAAVGYNAYSILKTGKDEYGKRYPFWFLSFGDYKNPFYIYLTSFSVWFFGLNSFSVRFLSAFLGSLTILGVFFLIREIFKKDRKEFRNFLAFLCSFLTATSFWHIFYSRMVYESIIALFFTIWGLFFLLKGREKRFYFPFCYLFFVLAIFSYNSPLFILPIVVILTVIIFRKEYFRKKKILFIFLACFYLFIGGYFFIFGNLIEGRSEATIFSNSYLITQLARIERGEIEKPIISSVFRRKKAYVVYKFISNYLASFKSEFLFFEGDGHLWHGIGLTGKKIGNISLLLLPFFILGIYYILKERKKEFVFVFAWFLISPFASSFTQDAPNTTRMNQFLFLFSLISATGFYFIYAGLKRNKYLLIVFVMAVFLNLGLYLFIYFGEYKERLCDFSFKEMNLCESDKIASFIKKNKERYEKIVFLTEEPSEEPYIQMAVYLEFNPAEFQKKAVWEKNGFYYVKKYKNFYFQTFYNDKSLEETRRIADFGKNLYIFRFKQERAEAISGEKGVIKREIFRIKDYNNKTLWIVGDNL